MRDVAPECAYPATVADYDPGFDPITSYDQGSTGGGYTVRAGDTLAGIAAALWGDSSLWYKLADANGLSAASALVEGQTLTIPVGVQSSGHNSSTFKPYDPSEVLGDTSPSTPVAPKPQKGRNKCGLLGTILIIAIAVAITVILKAPVTGLVTGLLKGSVIAGAAGVIGAAATGAIASIVSQGVGVATGIQQKFSWKGVAMSALSAGITQGVGTGTLLNGAGKFANDVARGALVNAATQGVAVATGLQKKFSWTGVAVAGVVSGVTGALSRALPNGAKAELRDASKTVVRKAVEASRENLFASSLGGAVAGAATRSVLTGTSFGDNLIAVLPDVIGATIGNMIGEAINDRSVRKSKNSAGTGEAKDPESDIVITNRGERPYNVLTDGFRLEPFELNISPELQALMEFSSQRELLLNLAAVEGGDALRTMIAKADPRQLAALREALTQPQGSRSASASQDARAASTGSSTVEHTNQVGNIPPPKSAWMRSWRARSTKSPTSPRAARQT